MNEKVKNSIDFVAKNTAKNAENLSSNRINKADYHNGRCRRALNKRCYNEAHKHSGKPVACHFFKQNL